LAQGRLQHHQTRVWFNFTLLLQIWVKRFFWKKTIFSWRNTIMQTARSTSDVSVQLVHCCKLNGVRRMQFPVARAWRWFVFQLSTEIHNLQGKFCNQTLGRQNQTSKFHTFLPLTSLLTCSMTKATKADYVESKDWDRPLLLGLTDVGEKNFEIPINQWFPNFLGFAYHLWVPYCQHVLLCSSKSQCTKYNSIKNLGNQNWHKCNMKKLAVRKYYGHF